MRPAARAALLFAVLGAASVTTVAQAHVPNIATFVLSEGEPGWRLEVHMSTSGMHQALTLLHPNLSLHGLDPQRYESLVVEALRDGIKLSYDESPVVLGQAAVGIRAHASTVTFRVAAPPEGTQQVHARIDALSERGGQNNVFRVVASGASAHVVLKADNGFSGSLAVATPSRPPATSATRLRLLTEFAPAVTLVAIALLGL